MRRSRILILGSICAVGVVAAFTLARLSWHERKRIEQAEAELAMIENGLKSFYDEFGTFSFESMSATEVLKFLCTRFSGGPIFVELWQGQGTQPIDPWGRAYCMIPGDFQTAPFFYSAGPNGIDEGARSGSDDVTKHK